MLHEDVMNNINYYQSLTEEQLEQKIDNANDEIDALGEMHESKRLGNDPHGPSLEDLEGEIETNKQHLELIAKIQNIFSKIHHLGYEYVKDSLDYHSDSFWMCVVTRQSEKYMFIYSCGRCVTLNRHQFHSVRRFTDTREDEF